MTQEIMHRLMKEQFAIDYGCSIHDFENKDTLVTVRNHNSLARKHEEQGILSILSYGGKLIISAAPELFDWSQSILAKRISAEWGFEAGMLILIDKKLNELGYTIDQAHLFFTPKYSMPMPKHPIHILHSDKIEVLKKDERIDEAFLFEDYIEDVLGTALYDSQNELLAVAGATANSDRMWEMGINSFAEGKGYASSALTVLTQEIMKLEKVPFYGTAMSHLASQNTALRAGFVPTFCELTTRKL